VTMSTPSAIALGPRPIDLIRPTTWDEAAITLRDSDDARILAGGTALMVLLQQGLIAPATLIALDRIADAARIEYSDNAGLTIGAMATMSDIASHDLVREHCMLLALACARVANIRVRNVATLGGNLAHADYQSDPPTALAALDASVIAWRAEDGQRRIPITDFLLDTLVTSLKRDEVVIAVHIPPGTEGWHASYVKYTARSSEERPCATVAVLGSLTGRVVRTLRIAVGAVAPVPMRMRSLEAALAGRELDGIRISQFSEALAAEISPLADLAGSEAQKRRLTEVLVRRAISDFVDSRSHS
jgi:carbon-monoxide dehydrogenase medium subunit